MQCLQRVFLAKQVKNKVEKTSAPLKKRSYGKEICCEK